MNKPGCVMKFCVAAAGLISLVLVVPYLFQTSYYPKENRKFSGALWYNPYKDLTDTLLRVNFHAHSKAWRGITWGEDSEQEVIDAYSDRGYHAPVLSNYHKITPAGFYSPGQIYIPVYEHGYNLKKVHCLCIGADHVSYLDFPWHFSINQTRTVIRTLRNHCDLVALAHPGARQAHNPDDMQLLEGLQLMEVANTQGARTAYWDATLSAGNAVWFLANDDTHDIEHDGEAFMRWNMIYTATPDANSALASLKQGNHYGVASYNGLYEDNRLTEFSISNDTLRISLRDSFNRLTFIGDDGVHLYSAIHDNAGMYVLQNTDSYVRAEVHQDHCVMYLNPVLRFDGKTPPHEIPFTPAINQFQTWAWRMLVLLTIGLIFLFLRKMLNSRQRKNQ